MERCDNCGALVEKCGTASDGKNYCCIHCCFNPLGCRCQYGEYGVAETEDWGALNGCYDDDEARYFDDDEGPHFEPCSRCDGHDACRDFGCAFKHWLGNMVDTGDDLPF